MLGMVFGLRLRQSEGFLSSVLELMELDLPVPDHTTLSRRAQGWKSLAKSHDRQLLADGPVHVLIDSTGLKVYGAGQWLEEKHGAKSRRSWRKLHLALDADSGEIIAHSLTDQDTSDTSQVEPLLNQIRIQATPLSRCSIRSMMRLTSSPPMVPMMASQPTTPFCVTAQPQGSSFHRAQRLWQVRTPLLPASATFISRRSTVMAA
jgi:hypothetical protein